MDSANIASELTKVLLTEKEILSRVSDLAAEVEADYKDKDLLLVGVLKGAIVLMSDFSRAMDRQVEIEWMAVSSYGSGTKSSGVVRILKDLDADVTGRNILVIEDILDSGLTLSWLRSNLESRGAKSVEILTLLRKPEAVKVDITPKYVGFDIPTEFVVGYGLDYSEKYRNLRDIGVLSPHIYS